MSRFLPKPGSSAPSPLRRSGARAGAVFSHHAACSLWGIDLLGEWPELVDVSVARTTGGRTTGCLRRRTRQLDGIELVPWAQHFVTSPAQTVIDMAAASPFVSGVVAADRALWVRRTGGALVSGEKLAERARAHRGRGGLRMRRVVEFATGESDSVRESQSRVVLDQLGFPPPQLQRAFVLPGGRLVRGDFSWEEWDHLGEFDGTGKYLDPSMLRGRSPEQAVIREKDREDALRRVVGRFSRWRTPELERPARLWDILVAAGLPSSRPRPGY